MMCPSRQLLRKVRYGREQQTNNLVHLVVWIAEMGHKRAGRQGEWIKRPFHSGLRITYRASPATFRGACISGPPSLEGAAAVRTSLDVCCSLPAAQPSGVAAVPFAPHLSRDSRCPATIL